MSDTPRTPDKNAAGILAIVVVLPIIYLLSVGPVVYALEKFHVPKSYATYVQTLYAPILWLHDHTSLKKLVENYVKWWEEMGRGR